MNMHYWHGHDRAKNPNASDPWGCQSAKGLSKNDMND